VRIPSVEEAREFIAGTSFTWHQRWELAPGVPTPGPNDVGWLMKVVGLPDDLTGRSVLDIGASNAACAFEAERRGASRVVAVDIFPAEHYGFTALAELLESDATFVRSSVYGLPSVLSERFDVVLFLGVLYHLRHPLLALDEVRQVTRGEMLLETAVSDAALNDAGDEPVVAFYRGDELGGDPSNWFAPNTRALLDWCASCGFDATLVDAWPNEAPERAAVRGRRLDGDPEWRATSYERPLRVEVTEGLAERW
jgi:tRNA (mo5U34)-methyltransferase